MTWNQEINLVLLVRDQIKAKKKFYPGEKRT